MCLYLYVVSTLRLAAARPKGDIQAGKEFPETHFVHSNNPGSTRILNFPSCFSPVHGEGNNRCASKTRKREIFLLLTYFKPIHI